MTHKSVKCGSAAGTLLQHVRHEMRLIFELGKVSRADSILTWHFKVADTSFKLFNAANFEKTRNKGSAAIIKNRCEKHEKGLIIV